MATHASAAKRHRQSLKRRDRNRFQKATIRTAIKSALANLEKGDIEGAKKATATATKLLDKAAIHGVMHRKTASRTISRLAKRVATGPSTKASSSKTKK